jgi:hypothetical protein
MKGDSFYRKLTTGEWEIITDISTVIDNLVDEAMEALGHPFIMTTKLREMLKLGTMMTILGYTPDNQKPSVPLLGALAMVQ